MSKDGPVTPLTKRRRPKAESFSSSALRLYTNKIISENTFMNLDNASNVTKGEAIRVLTDILIATKKRHDEELERWKKDEVIERWKNVE